MMNVSKHPIFAPLFFLVLFSLFKLKPCTGNNGTTVVHGCPEIEKQSLLSFKQSLHDPHNWLSSWNGDEANCCKWKWLRCSNLTGHVQQLHLQNSDFSGKVSPSLLNLKHLKYLDLSRNHFSETFPPFIGSLTSLEYLDLSSSAFHGNVPHNIGNLSNLNTLILGYSDSLESASLEWLSGLSKLEYLNMNNLNLSRASNWAQQVINKLPSLVELQLSGCSLNLTDHLGDVNNITTSKLVKLNLFRNQFINSANLEWLYFFKDLKYLDLGSNNLQNAISNSIANLTSLMTLGLSYNGLSGNIPRGIGNLCKLQHLKLYGNKLQGGLSDLLGNGNVSTACFLGSVESLDLSDNQLSGPLALKFGEFKRLRSLNLRSNSLSGVIPSNLGNLSSSLEELDLSDNKFTGNLPESIGQLSNLQTLDIENNIFIGNLPETIGQLWNLKILDIGSNKMEGVVTETHFANLSRLYAFSASRNHLTLKVNPNWIPPFKLFFLHLGSWNLGSPIMLPWLDTQNTSIQYLNLSNTGIYGNVPNWLWSITSLDLSHNQLDGNITFMSTGPARDDGQVVYLGSNRFSGQLPKVGNWFTSLDLSNNLYSGDLSDFLCNTTTTNVLENLHLGGNHLHGELPDCFINWPYLLLLNLGNNNLSGRIPNSIRFLEGLQSLNLNGNNFSGHIPLSMHKCTILAKMDLSHNNLSGNLPKLILKSFTELVILILKSNKLSGQITPSICQLNTLQILDLSDNMFYGTIPTCVDNFTAMATKRSSVGMELTYYSFAGDFIESASMSTKGMELTYDTILLLVTGIDLSRNNLSGTIPEAITSLVGLRMLNLSRNHLTGPIPRSIGNMTQLESLDFSINSLSGELPSSFTAMSSLNYLNVSCNNLTGRIPESTQLRGFNEPSFIGNNLCGPPLTVPCTKAPTGTVCSKDEKSDKKEIEWLYVFISLGYAVGLSGFLSTLYLKRSWWEAYCHLLDKIWDNAYVYILIKWRRVATARA